MKSSQVIPFGKLLTVDEKDSNRINKHQRKKLARKGRIPTLQNLIMINLVACNIRGLNSPLKQKEIKLLLVKNKI